MSRQSSTKSERRKRLDKRRAQRKTRKARRTQILEWWAEHARNWTGERRLLQLGGE